MTITLSRTRVASALASALSLASPDIFAAQTVTNCADSGAGSLRAALTNAANGDTVTFNTVAMNCSTITLTTGALAINVASLTISGPGGVSAVTIDGNQHYRVLDHEGNGMLSVNGLILANGYIDSAAPKGGCVYSKGSATVTNSTLTGCHAYSEGPTSIAYGGGIYTKKDLTLLNSTISASRAVLDPNQPSGTLGGGLGGGAYALGSLVVRSSSVTSCDANVGGGLSVVGNATIVGTTLSDNIAIIGGGLALAQSSTSQVSISDSTISGNKGYYGCGAIYPGKKFATPDITIGNSTVAFNKSNQAAYNGYNYAAGLCAVGTLELQSTIVSNNLLIVGMSQTASDFSAHAGTAISGANNLIMATLAGTTPPAGTLTAGPLLALLANNGGPVMTHALQAGSPAIGAGNNLARLASDGRGAGFARMTRESTDIGAFQTGDGIFASGFE